jgi:hypothetical protein
MRRDPTASKSGGQRLMQMNEKFGALSLSEHFNLSNLTQFYYFDVELGPYWPLAQV